MTLEHVVATSTITVAAVDASALGALHLQARVLAHRDFAAAATAFVSELAAALGCTRVTLGFTRRDAIGLVAVSGGGHDKLQGDDFTAIADAMDEARQQAASIHVPADGATRPLVTLAHVRLRQRQGGAVASLPIMQWGEAVGVVTFEWMHVPPQLAAQVHALESPVNLVGPVLDLMRRREKALWWHGMDKLRTAARHVSERPRLRFVLGAAAVGVLLLAVVPVPYHVGGMARVQGEEQRSVAAPADGFLKAAHVRPGDRVQRGQVLAEMATDDLQLVQQKWNSELGQQQHAYAAALANADRAQMVIALARADQAQAQLALVDADLARSVILAPFPGVVLEGDLSQSIGSPIERGKPLMVLSPGDAQRVVVEVDERDVAEVRVGQSGRLALSALPWDTIALQVTRVTPIARVAEGRNVFEVEARMAPEDAARVRPGLRGAAKIAVGRAPLLWNWSHHALAQLRLVLWRWWA